MEPGKGVEPGKVGGAWEGGWSLGMRLVQVDEPT